MTIRFAQNANAGVRPYRARCVVSRAVSAYQVARFQDPRGSAEALKRLFGSLRAIAQGDTSIKQSLTYDYYRRDFTAAEADRKSLLEAWDKVLSNLKDMQR